MAEEWRCTSPRRRRRDAPRITNIARIGSTAMRSADGSAVTRRASCRRSVAWARWYRRRAALGLSPSSWPLPAHSTRNTGRQQSSVRVPDGWRPKLPAPSGSGPRIRVILRGVAQRWTRSPRVRSAAAGSPRGAAARVRRRAAAPSRLRCACASTCSLGCTKHAASGMIPECGNVAR